MLAGTLLKTRVNRTINPVDFSLSFMNQSEEITLKTNLFESFPYFPELIFSIKRTAFSKCLSTRKHQVGL